ncbi:MAG: hypothetical protein C0514_06490 [Candidatus Puniceispirillum sp.]|nr:hypothetical protein [Candidatus Puniceispirillum sp.]
MKKVLLTAMTLMLGAASAQANGMMGSVLLESGDFSQAFQAPLKPVTLEQVLDADANAAPSSPVMRRSSSQEDLSSEYRARQAVRSTWYGRAYDNVKSFVSSIVSWFVR